MVHSLSPAHVITLFILLTAHPAIAHPYLPLESGRTTVMDYDFQVVNSTMKNGAEPVRGQMIMKSANFEEKFEKSYLHYITSYRDIPFMKDDQSMWRREENGNVFVGSTLEGKWSETLELPADVSIGREWEYFDGQRSLRKITAHLNLKLPNGEIISDCIEVSRIVLKDDSMKNATNKNYFCRDKGDAGSIFRLPSPIGEYVTETKVRSFSPENK